jgi:hypothetical protein
MVKPPPNAAARMDVVNEIRVADASDTSLRWMNIPPIVPDRGGSVNQISTPKFHPYEQPLWLPVVNFNRKWVGTSPTHTMIGLSEIPSVGVTLAVASFNVDQQ